MEKTSRNPRKLGPSQRQFRQKYENKLQIILILITFETELSYRYIPQ
jgi:hypothetical protein